MTRRRRSAASGDSLELLLDTICNTFGGIVFIALLIILLLRQTATLTEQPTAEEIVTPAELMDRVTRLETVTAELQSLRAAKADLARRAEAFAPPEVSALLQQRNAAAAEVDRLRSERDAQIAANASAAADISRSEAELRALAGELEQVEEAVKQSERKLTTTRSSKTEEIRMPVVRTESQLRNVGLILRYGRMYVWHNYDANGNRLGLNTDEFVVTDDQGPRLVTRPDPTKGVPLTAGNSAQAAIAARLRSFPPQEFTVTIVVRPDSFEQFAVLRDWLLSRGYRYRLMPSDSGVIDRGGSDSRVQGS